MRKERAEKEDNRSIPASRVARESEYDSEPSDVRIVTGQRAVLLKDRDYEASRSQLES